MGLFLSRLFDRLASVQPRRIVLIGLDAAGKTTVLYKLHIGENVHTIPTVGFNVETVTYKNVEMTCWDIGGQKKIRALWRYYYQGTDAVIFVVDSTDRNRMEEAKEELFCAMNDDLLQNAKLLVYANKQDQPGAVSPSELIGLLGLNTSLKNRVWHVQGTVALTGAGLYEGLDWLAHTLSKK